MVCQDNSTAVFGDLKSRHTSFIYSIAVLHLHAYTCVLSDKSEYCKR